MFIGTVQKGSELGHKLGFPTANIPLGAGEVSGVYAARVQADGKTYSAAVYYNAPNKALEAHLLDFNGDLYGKEIAIELVHKMREDKVFATEDDARATIAQDVAGIRDYFNRG